MEARNIEIIPYQTKYATEIVGVVSIINQK